MGTTTIFTRLNDLGLRFEFMKKDDLKKLENLSPLKDDNHYHGWKASLELHNGNVHVLVWWKGRLIKLEDAPRELNKKYYDKYSGKTLKEYEWTLLKGMILKEMTRLDKEFKKNIKRKLRSNSLSLSLHSTQSAEKPQAHERYNV